MKQLTAYAKQLRNNQTDAEIHLWKRIKSRQLKGYKFRRQHIFSNYIVDFVCIELKLIIEIDGSQHQAQKEYDKIRTQYLNSIGFKVLRFWNNEILEQVESVVEAILQALPSAITQK